MVTFLVLTRLADGLGKEGSLPDTNPDTPQKLVLPLPQPRH